MNILNKLFKQKNKTRDIGVKVIDFHAEAGKKMRVEIKLDILQYACDENLHKIENLVKKIEKIKL